MPQCSCGVHRLKRALGLVETTRIVTLLGWMQGAGFNTDLRGAMEARGHLLPTPIGDR